MQEFKEWIKEHRNEPLQEIMETVRKKLIGHYNYYGITDNIKGIERYYQEVRRMMYKWLNRRSQKKSYTYEEFNMMYKTYKLPKPKITVQIYAV